MRLTGDSRPENVSAISEFAEWILKVEDRMLGEANDGEDEIHIPEEILLDEDDDPDFINGLKFSGVPNQKLMLKVDVSTMLLRNVDQQIDYMMDQVFGLLD
nr:ATP-dependent DNA helicase PIF1-like [Tanacetum cinerariifolium]